MRVQLIIEHVDDVLFLSMQIPDHIRTLHKFPRIFEKKMPWKQWKYLCKEWTSFVVRIGRSIASNLTS